MNDCDGCGVGNGCACHDCCAGIEPATPESTANPPGLPALAYRAGTHASFMETMRARLSSAAYPELAGLTTRDGGDPSIALLDAWATVADVLTFYQERIANESYLRTATERFSVFELARLIGYSPRPGVAASVYAAFELDKGAVAAVPAGTRIQSLPAPGELPQTFETAEAIAARGDWNNLQVRLTRPQSLAAGKLARSGALYFRGITTNLKANDALLVDFGTSRELHRVREVETQMQADRTRVLVEPWVPVVTKRNAVEGVLRAVERFRDPQAVVSPASKTTARILGRLERFRAGLPADTPDAELSARVDELLPELEEEHRLAAEGGFTRLEPWIGGLITELKTAAAGEPVTATMATAPVVTRPPQLVAGLPDLLPALGKRASIPPRNDKHLALDVAKAFGPQSDLAPRLLTAVRPELRETLYKAWANAPVTPEPEVEVYVLRDRAAVFGYNAPPELVRRDDGVITGSREWTLHRRRQGEPEPFRFELLLTLPTGEEFALPNFRGSVSAGGLLPLPLPLTRSSERAFEFPYPAAEDVVVVTFLEVSVETLLPVRLSLALRNRGISVTISLGSGGEELAVESQGTDPTRTTVHASVEQRTGIIVVSGDSLGTPRTEPTEDPLVVWLDAPYPQLLPGSWIVLDRPAAAGTVPALVITRASRVAERSRSEYGMSAKSTRVELGLPWLDLERDRFAVVRGTAVLARSERLELAEEPIDPVLEDVCGGAIELARLYDGLEPGRWVVVSGERTDIAGPAGPAGRPDPTTGEAPAGARVPGVPARELAMIAGVEQVFDPRLPGDRTHTRLVLANDLAYCYRRDTLTVYGNVARATHGETVAQVLGSGDASQALQRFALNRAPLTWVSARNPSGVESTLAVRVDGVLWRRAGSLAGLGPADRAYVTRMDDEERTTLTFGNGERGARLPTGQENVTAVYRAGIGAEANLPAGQISLLITRPAGVLGVVNPLPASGGAGPESRDQARRNAPLAVMALDRLVSVVDYADFSRTFAGIGKASAARLSDGRAQVVHVTIAGVDDIPILETSDLYRNLGAALRELGDPGLPVRLEVREAALLVVSAGVKVAPELLWEHVEPRVRAALLDTFGFDRRELGQDVLLSEVVAAIQGVRGVEYVDVDILSKATGSIDPADLERLARDLGAGQPRERIAADPARAGTGPGGGTLLRPAQIVYLSPAVPDTLILKEIPA